MSNIPKRYLKGVNKEERIKEIEERKKAVNVPFKELFPKKTDKEAIKKGIVKKSKYTKLFNELYPDLKFDLREFSKKFNIPYDSLKEVYDKGLKAWQTSGSRAGANATMWGIARVYKFILITLKKAPPTKNDPDEYLRKK
jgi:hypothetical protein